MNLRRKALRTLFASLALSLSLATLLSASAQEGMMKKSLYERLGGYNAVAAVVDDFVGRLVADKQFERFFESVLWPAKKCSNCLSATSRPTKSSTTAATAL